VIEKFDMLYKKENTDPKIDFHLLKNGKAKLISTKMQCHVTHQRKCTKSTTK